MVPVILVDSNIWIFANLEHYAEWKLASAALERIAKKQEVILTNAVVEV